MCALVTFAKLAVPHNGAMRSGLTLTRISIGWLETGSDKKQGSHRPGKPGKVREFH